jgi:hypothetical protein
LRPNPILLLAAAGALAAFAPAANDHAIIDRGFAPGRDAERADTHEPIRISGARGERCETRLAVGSGQRLLDWRTISRMQLSRDGRGYSLIISADATTGVLVVRFPDAESATPVLLAMERLQTACRPKAS